VEKGESSGRHVDGVYAQGERLQSLSEHLIAVELSIDRTQDGLVMRPNLSLRSLAAIAGALLSISTAAAGDLRIGFTARYPARWRLWQDQLDGFLLGLEQAAKVRRPDDRSGERGRFNSGRMSGSGGSEAYHGG